MDLVTYLNEYPTAILGGFDPSYLELPEEILITVMRDHQKYFALERKDGTLAPNFLAVINLDKDKAGLIRAGHERVLRARFADARFFWETDQKCRLADYLPKLGSRDLPGKARQLRRKSRAHARAGSLALGAMVRQRDCRMPASAQPIAPPSFPSAISSPRWFGNLPSCRESSAAFTQKLKENLKKLPGPFTTITSLQALRIRSPETLPGRPWRSPTNSIRWSDALRWGSSPQVQVILSLCAGRRWASLRFWLRRNCRYRFPW